jgi:DNA-binding GntR family transcriptional regulator
MSNARHDFAMTPQPATESAEPPLGLPNYHRVRDAIRADIARGVLPCNTRLKIGALSQRYGLSPAPIREALNQLEAEGWIVILPNRGASVRNIDEAFLRDLNEIRIALESYFVRLAAEVATPQDVDRLAAIQDEYEAAVLREDVAALIHLNARFHATIASLRPNQEASAIIRRHSKFFNAMRAEWGYQPHRPREIAREHRILLDAFRRNDGAAAEQISREHLRHAMNDLLARWREGSPRPAPPELPLAFDEK